MKTINLVSHGSTSWYRKDNKRKSSHDNKKDGVKNNYDKCKKAQFKGNYRFCKKFGHKKVDCFKYRKWLKKKKGSTFLALVCCK